MSQSDEYMTQRECRGTSSSKQELEARSIKVSLMGTRDFLDLKVSMTSSGRVPAGSNRLKVTHSKTFLKSSKASLVAAVLRGVHPKANLINRPREKILW